MINETVVYKRKNLWFTGSIKEGKLRKKKQIKKLGDVTETEDYITLKRWVKENKKGEPEEYLTKYNVQSLYILKKAKKAKEGKKTVSGGLWKKFNPQCLKCKKDCKQSYKVIIISCQYKAKKK